MRLRAANPGTNQKLESSGQPDVGFVACIEGGVLERQALLLFESIRRFTGAFCSCAVYALSPRAGHTISNHARRRLDELQVTYIEEILNAECSNYGSANRVAAASYIEQTRNHEILVVLDSDTLFLREPTDFTLPANVDVAVRPVDVKGISTNGPEDAFDAYWRSLCECCDAEYNRLPFTKAFVDGQRIKANYNGGLVVVRARVGVLRKWGDYFFESIRRGLRPYNRGPSFRAGVGWVESEVGRFWGSNQAALSLAIWNTTDSVVELPSTYNYPLHLHGSIDREVSELTFPILKHVHYHWLFARDAISSNPLFLLNGPLSTEQRNWLRSATPFDED